MTKEITNFEKEYIEDSTTIKNSLVIMLDEVKKVSESVPEQDWLMKWFSGLSLIHI